MIRVQFGRTVSIGLARQIYEGIERFEASRPQRDKLMIGLFSEGSAVRGLLVENVAREEIVPLAELPAHADIIVECATADSFPEVARTVLKPRG